MNFRRVLLVVVLLGGFWFVTTHLPDGVGHLGMLNRADGKSPLSLTEAQAAPEFDTEEQNNIAVYKRVLPSVVNITSTAMTFNFFYGQVPQQGQGSGFILDKAGHVLTNFHVIADANRIEVMLSDKRHYKATIVGSDKVHDLALLQINAPNLQPVTLSDSTGLVVGQKVYAIGNPFGLNGTMTRGIISSIRSIRGPENAPIEDAIQTDAAINPGNSGGPLLNSRGDVIGINTLIASNGAEQSSGIGFAIPVNTAKAVLGDLTKYGRVRRPSLGIVSLAIGPDLADQMGLSAQSGVLVQKVTPGGAAERAGLRGGDQQAYLGNQPIILGGDLIVAIDGHEITDTSDIATLMEKHQPNDTVTVTFYRGRRKMTARLTLSEGREIST
ncbi:S1C family serine protease [Acidicapsa ligni]|uniref:S1C family serine protease n=1 Tax=Acidicapsa ligni TaxID=542300 RepID=UPI0021DFD8E6|nr:trypsin-like peptidase domain-containing protein [Acidicapsa ligni]